MCGICGYFVNQTPKQQHARLLRGLLLANSARGTDSTGVAYFNKKVRVHKDEKKALDFLATLPHSTAKIAIGHTRMATTGAPIKKNAHPFTKGHITGVHNGMIHNYLEINPKVDVDSEVIFELINKVGFVEAFKQIEGSCAAMWVDDRLPDTLFFIKHNNPLSVAIVGKDFIFSSQEDHLFPQLVAVGIEPIVYEIDDDTVYKLSSGGVVEATKVEFKKWYYKPVQIPPDTSGAKDLRSLLPNADAIDETLEEYRRRGDEESFTFPPSIYEFPTADRDQTIRDIAKDYGCSECAGGLSGWGFIDEDGFLFCHPCGRRLSLYSAINFNRS